MIKRIKNYFHKKKLERQAMAEIIETLVTICMYLEVEGRYHHNYMAGRMGTHTRALKELSYILRKSEVVNYDENEKSY